FFPERTEVRRAPFAGRAPAARMQDDNTVLALNSELTQQGLHFFGCSLRYLQRGIWRRGFRGISERSQKIEIVLKLVSFGILSMFENSPVEEKRIPPVACPHADGDSRQPRNDGGAKPRVCMKNNVKFFLAQHPDE